MSSTTTPETTAFSRRTACLLAGLGAFGLAGLGAPKAANAALPTLAEIEKATKPVRYQRSTNQSSIDTGGAALIVEAPAKRVQAIVTKYGRYNKYVPYFKQARLLQAIDGNSDVYVEVPILKGTATIWSVLQFKEPKQVGDDTVIAADLVKGNVKEFQVTWRFRPLDDKRTLVRLEILVDPDLALPSSLVTYGLRVASDRGVSAVRDYAEGKKKLPKKKP